jgi:pterin-4a-carbinolamine dehydratase
MPNSIFISYRRSDSQHAALAVADALGWAFPEGEVFFDRVSIEGASDWSRSIQDAAHQARLMVVVIGEGWLKASDTHGRRRIDQPKDWVRQELLSAIRRQIRILPVTLDKAEVPSPEALDPEIEVLHYQQPLPVRVSSWESDLHAVIERIAEITGLPSRKRSRDEVLNPNGTPIPRPDRRRRNETVLSREELRQELDDLSTWRFEINHHPWAIGGKAEEIARVYEFRSFENATRFMAEASAEIGRWQPTSQVENQTLTTRH